MHTAYLICKKLHIYKTKYSEKSTTHQNSNRFKKKKKNYEKQGYDLFAGNHRII